MNRFNRRNFLWMTGAATLSAPALGQLLWSTEAAAALGNTLTIAYNLSVPSWDPATGLSSVNPGLQTIYKSVFDQYVDQNEDLTQKPGILTRFSWSADKSKVHFRVRGGAKWHDGKPVTAADIVWNLERVGDPKNGNPVAFIWGSIGNFTIDGNDITAEVKTYRPTLLGWLSFLTGYVIAPQQYEKLGREGFEKSPMGSGPYMVERYERGSFVRLKASPHYWGAKPAFETVVFKFITDASSRVAEIESGSSDFAVDLPYEEYDRLRKKPGLVGKVYPVSDIGMIFFNDVGPMVDENVRRAAVHAVDKKAIVDRLLRGYATPIDTLMTPNYVGFDPSVKTPYDPELARKLLAKSGFSRANPVEFTIQTTRGYKPKDYEMVQAIVGMWRKVGIKANIEVYEIAKHYELRAQDKLAPAAFYNWGNSTADPESSTGHAMFGPSPHSVWDTDDLDAMIGPLFAEKDDKKRLAGYIKVNRYIAEKAYVLPLVQYHQPVVYKKGLVFKPHTANYVLPYLMRRGG